MLKIRLKRIGRKRQPAYRIVIMESKSRRDGRPIAEIGYYNPISKQLYYDPSALDLWQKYGAKTTKTVGRLISSSSSSSS